jgi:hypothetical protein
MMPTHMSMCECLDYNLKLSRCTDSFYFIYQRTMSANMETCTIIHEMDDKFPYMVFACMGIRYVYIVVKPDHPYYGLDDSGKYGPSSCNVTFGKNSDACEFGIELPKNCWVIGWGYNDTTSPSNFIGFRFITDEAALNEFQELVRRDIANVLHDCCDAVEERASECREVADASPTPSPALTVPCHRDHCCDDCCPCKETHDSHDPDMPHHLCEDCQLRHALMRWLVMEPPPLDVAVVPAKKTLSLARNATCDNCCDFCCPNRETHDAHDEDMPNLACVNCHEKLNVI